MKRVCLLSACIALAASVGAHAAERIAGPFVLEETVESPLGLYGVALPLANGQVPMLVNPQGPAQVPHLWTDLDALLAQDALDTVVFPAEGHSGAITRLDAPGQCLYNLGWTGAQVLWVPAATDPSICTVWQNEGNGRIVDRSTPGKSAWLTYQRYGTFPGYLVTWAYEPAVRIRTDLMVELAP